MRDVDKDNRTIPPVRTRLPPRPPGHPLNVGIRGSHGVSVLLRNLTPIDPPQPYFLHTSLIANLLFLYCMRPMHASIQSVATYRRPVGSLISSLQHFVQMAVRCSGLVSSRF